LCEAGEESPSGLEDGDRDDGVGGDINLDEDKCGEGEEREYYWCPDKFWPGEAE
jgi:hypothetical protein